VRRTNGNRVRKMEKKDPGRDVATNGLTGGKGRRRGPIGLLVEKEGRKKVKEEKHLLPKPERELRHTQQFSEDPAGLTLPVD